MSKPARAEIILLPVAAHRADAGAPEPALTRAEICLRLRDLQRRRQFCIKQQSHCDRSIESHLAFLLGYHNGLDPDTRKKLFAAAAKIRRLIEANPDFEPEEPRLQGVQIVVLGSAGARQVWDRLRPQIEREMSSLACQLPVWPWVREVKGVAELGLAVIVGEAGRDLVNFATPAKLWKMLGLAVLEGRRQGNPENRTAEEWTKHGYNPPRRGAIWPFLSDVLLRAQWRKGDEEAGVPGRALGPYGEVYAERKQWTAAARDDWTPKHIDNDARRIMSKRFLRDLWVAWQATAAPQD